MIQNQSSTNYTPEQTEWINKLQKIIKKNRVCSYETPHTRSVMCKKAVEFVLDDNCEILFNFNKGPNKNLASVIYSKTKEWEKDILSNIKRQYKIYPDHEREYNAFASLMKRYRKEHRKLSLLKYLIPQARCKVADDTLYDETKLPKEIITNIITYL